MSVKKSSLQLSIEARKGSQAFSATLAAPLCFDLSTVRPKTLLPNVCKFGSNYSQVWKPEKALLSCCANRKPKRIGKSAVDVVRK